jgi:hypothetical protein
MEDVKGPWEDDVEVQDAEEEYPPRGSIWDSGETREDLFAKIAELHEDNRLFRENTDILMQLNKRNDQHNHKLYQRLEFKYGTLQMKAQILQREANTTAIVYNTSLFFCLLIMMLADAKTVFSSGV